MNIVMPRNICSLLIAGWIPTLIGCKKVENEYVPPPPPDVTVAYPVQLSITPFLEENAVIEAVEEAEVRARVRGFVEAIDFEPGQKVKQGDVLYHIESDQYQAIVNSGKAAVAASEASIGVAEAMVKTVEAELTRTEQDLTRQKSLLEQRAGSQAEYDAAVAANDAAVASLDSANANVQAAVAEKGRNEATLAQAQLDLDYTKVRAPIGGRISITDIKQGNLVENGGQMATVVDRDEVFANFSISDRDMLRFMKAQRAKLKPGQRPEEPDLSEVPIYLRRESDQGFPIVGVLNNVDQVGIDAATGTLGMRAKFDNRDDRLFPGLFVQVRMPTGDPVESIVVPEYAALRDQRGEYALVVNDAGEVERADITVSQAVSGWAVIESGLTPQSRVVIDGLQRARPGLEVTATDRPLNVDDDALLRGTSLSGNTPPANDRAADPSDETEEKDESEEKDEE